MKSYTRTRIQYITAVVMLAIGAALSIAGFIVPPTGEISDSVLWFFAQCLIYAGSIFGVSTYVHGKFTELSRELDRRIIATRVKMKVNEEAESSNAESEQ